MNTCKGKYRLTTHLFSIISVSLFLISCGGGGGDSSDPNFTVSTNELNVALIANAGQAPEQTISGTVSNYDGPLYIIISHTNNGISTVHYPTISGNTGTSAIVMQYKTQGVYFDTIIVQACSEPTCTDQLPGSPQIIDVTYSVGIAVDPPALSFSATAGSAPPSQTITVYYGFELTGTSWGSSYLYLDGSDWMSYTPPSGQAPSVVEVTLDSFPVGTAPGVYNAEIRFGANQGKTQVTLPIQYTVN